MALTTRRVEVATRTWARDTHNLFDFEADHASITSQSFTLREPAVLVRNVNSVGVTPDDQAGDMLLQLDFNSFRNKFLVQRPRRGRQEERRTHSCWQLIRGDSLGHRLAPGDIIKFGRSQFKVRQLALNRVGPTALDIDRSDCTCHVDLDHLSNSPDQPCRICLSDGSTAEDPLLAPCNCKGSIQHVHLECLRHWVKDRLGLTSGDAPFAYESLSCELCKTTYSTSVMIGHRKVPLIEIDCPFIILESVSEGSLTVLPFVGGRAVTVGRGGDCNMKIEDVAISRVQAAIELSDGHFILKDHGSRFGTFVKITKPRSLEMDEEVTVQVGRSLLTFTAKFVVHELGTKSSVAEEKQEKKTKNKNKFVTEPQDELITLVSSVQGDDCTDNNEYPRTFGHSVSDSRPSFSQVASMSMSLIILYFCFVNL